MRRSKYRRGSSSKWFSGRRRIIAAVSTVVAFGAIVTVTQVSDASTRRSTQRALAACDRIQAPRTTDLSTETRRGTYTTNKGRVTQHADDGAGNVPTTAEMRRRCRQWVMQNAGNNGGNAGGGAAAPSQSPDTNNGGQNGDGQNGDGQNGGQNGDGQNGGQNGDGQNGGQNGDGQNGGGDNNGGGQNGGGDNNGGGQNGGGDNNGGGGNNAPPVPPGVGLGILANNCDNSNLTPHDGFQNGDRCVSTAFGEVGAAENNPSLLITDAPQQVGVGEAFQLRVSTRNLIRDRFLAAGQGGYYVESSVLQDGIVRGHFHTACRMLSSEDEAPDPAPVPAFFVATEDQQGGRAPDQVTINVTGMPEAGVAQCASWAGDGSHRIPMMQRANQTPAFDAVRIQVGGGDNNNDGDQGQNNN